MATIEKQVMVVGVDDSEDSLYALQWTLEHFFTPFSSNCPYKLIIVHAKPPATTAIGVAGPGVADVLPLVEEDLRKIAARIVGKAKEICINKSVKDATVEVVDGDARNALCDAVQKHQATILVVGSHGYGALKRYNCALKCEKRLESCRIIDLINF